MSITLQNLESALAGESMAFTKYMYFAKIARESGFDDVAEHFELTAQQELKHAWGHLELLIGRPDVPECLAMAIAGETYEYTEMYPLFEAKALREGNYEAAQEAKLQAEDSHDHALAFIAVLNKAQKRFAALKRVEKRHAEAYQQVLDNL